MYLPILPHVIRRLSLFRPSSLWQVVLGVGDTFRQDALFHPRHLILQKHFRDFDILSYTLVGIDARPRRPVEKERLDQRSVRDRRVACADCAKS